MNSSRLLERLAKTELGQQLLAEETAEVLAHRQELAGEIERLTAEEEQALPSLLEAEQKALAAVERAREKLKAAQEAHGQAVAARTHLCNSHQMRRTQLESELYTTAPPAIAAFRGWLQDLWDGLRRSRFQVTEPRRDVMGNVIADDGPNPYQQQAERLARVRDAQRAAEGLMLQALTEEELAERLADLRRSVGAEPE